MTLAVESIWRRLRYTRMRDVLRGRLDGQLDWRRVVASAELPTEIADTITEVVGKTRLWNGERVDVCTELLAHFRDGLEAGQAAQKLVADFGDTAQAAALIRRAKKRNRPLWWRMMRGCCWFFSCFAAVYALLAIYMYTERSAINTDYLAILNSRATAVAEEEAAWPGYREAMLALGCRNSQPPEPLPKTWNRLDAATLLDGTDDVRGIRDFLVEHQTQLAALREATTKPRLGYVIGHADTPEDLELLGYQQTHVNPADEPKELISILLGHVQVLRYAGKLLAGDALLAAESNDAERAYENLTACLGVVQHVQESPFLISGMVSFTLERELLVTVENTLRQYPQLFSDKQLVGLAHRVAAIHPQVEDWYEHEKLFMLDTMQRIYGDSGRVTHEGAIYLGHLESVVGINSLKEQAHRAQQALVGVGLPVINLMMASRDEQLAKYNEIWRHQLANNSKPLWQLTSEESQLDRLSRSKWKKIKYTPLIMLMPALQSFRMTWEYNAGRREGAQVGIALELYRRKHGSWPESLEQLVPHWLPKVPIDRINGGPLGYLATSDGVVVYSYGTDTDDDGGRPPEASRDHSRTSRYEVHPPAPITAETNPMDVRRQDGDWLLWSTKQVALEPPSSDD